MPRAETLTYLFGQFDILLANILKKSLAKLQQSVLSTNLIISYQMKKEQSDQANVCLVQ